MKKILGILLALCAVFGSQLFAAELKGLSGVILKFESRLESNMFDKPLRSSGFMVANSSGSVRWQTLSPSKSITLFSDGSVSFYEFADGKWRRLSSPSASEKAGALVKRIAAMVLGGKADPSWKLEKIAGGIVVKMPKDDPSGLLSIESFYASNGTVPKKIRLRYIDGDTREIDFSSVKENPSNIGGALDERNPDFLKFEF